jgi:hypothetical protein
MNEVEWLKSLDNTGPAPLVDVLPGVMHAIRTAEPEPDSERIYQLAAVVALLVGGLALVLGLPALTPGLDPFGGLAESFNLVLR